MKKLLFTTLLIAFAIAPALSQKNVSKDERSQRKEKIETLRIAFFTEKLEMTTEESTAFFARQNDFEESIADLKKEYKHLRTKKDSDSISDKEHAQGVTQRAEFKKKEIDLNSSFILDCFDILDAKRAIAIPEIKKNFRKEILAKRNNTVKEK
ncbi:MAG: hypothetical protein HOH96_08440 [Flavobacteriales bacterium]|jgi:hypothetical protein|nr:hypothetical protein [Flavobacteriales bacterium]